MKQKISKLGLAGTLLILLSFSLFVPKQSFAETPYGISFQVFYDELMPYGDWVKDASYGYIWLPAVGNDFHPYGSNGHWVMTEYGNTWVSYYDWGWAPFHYGRWYFDDYYQSWAWIPDYTWGPAWVNWRTGGGYYGWAPMGPNLSISLRINVPSFHWVFLPNRRIYHPYAYNYYAPRKTKIKIYNNTTIINNTVVHNNNRYVAGPNRREIERVTRQTVPVYSIRGSKAPGRASVSRNGVELYRPDLSASRGRTVDARPSRVATADQVRNNRTQARNTYSDSPSRNARSSTNSTMRSNGRSTTTAPSRSNNGSRSASPSTRNKQFEAKPYEQGRSRTASPSTRTQSSRNQPSRSSTQTSPSRSSTREYKGRVSQPNNRTKQAKPQTYRSRTQSSPAVRKSPERVSRPPQSRKSSPTVRSSGTNQSRSSRSAPKVNSRTSTSKTSSSASTVKISSSRSRGNN
ncbi:DUF6600 domain-containing protein [Algoriphagus sp. SE2]|uniref:DUF6600 domain-containing protein n=1 Tax=Algoriphagus sp. SE2 TaxID=3141536 RepID=UPI0031CCDE96